MLTLMPSGAFLIPYAIALATLGLPLFILELAVSHPDPQSHSDPDPDPDPDLAIFGHLWPSGHQTTRDKYGQVGYP